MVAHNFGILQPKGTDNVLDVPGTALLEELEQRTISADAFSKRDSKNPEIILVPTPSDDPADPLNWSPLKKEIVYGCLLMGTVLAGTAGPIVVPAFVGIAQDYGRPLSDISQINGSFVLAIGIGSVLFAPLQTKWGARPSFILTALLAFISMLWAGGSGSNFPSMIAARVIQGLSAGCYFNNVPAAVNSIFFVHQRGLRISLWNLSLIGGINIGPIISAQIIQAQGWTAAFWWQSLVAGLVLIATVVFVQETIYDRAYYDIEIARRREALHSEAGSDCEKGQEVSAAVAAPTASTATGWRAYKLSTGSKTDVPFWKLAVRPLYYAASPVVIWGSITWSVIFNLLPFIATVYSQIFSAPPYNLSTSAVGLISGIPPLIGTVAGTAISGPLSDWSAKGLSKRAGGVYEPEYRLVLMILFLVFGGIGFYGWGLQTSDDWVVPAVFMGILHVGISAASTSCIGYVSDSLGNGAPDALGLVVLVKSLTGFGLIFIINDWYATRGPRQFFVSLGSLVVATSGFALVAWIWGKRARHWSASFSHAQ